MSDTQMDLSEAIRLGAMLKPQGFGALHTRRRTGLLGLFGESIDATCALGAAFEAAGCPSVAADPQQQFHPIRGNATANALASYSIQVPPHWNQVLHHSSVCPECKVSDVVFRLIAHLNDKHQWTRGSIADFVETIEAQLRESARQFEPWLEASNRTGRALKRTI